LSAEALAKADAASQFNLHIYPMTKFGQELIESMRPAGKLAARKRVRGMRVSRLARVLVDTAKGMHEAGLLDRTTYDKIARRHPGARTRPRPRR
jgi:hypothetical protein